MLGKTTLLTKDNGDDLPPRSRVEVSLSRPAYRWRCDACGTNRRFHRKETAFDAAWQHYTHTPCRELDPSPPATLGELGLKDYRGDRHAQDEAG